MLFRSIGSEIRSGGSFDWRRLENEAAFKVIAAHPLMGVGMGGEYKKVKTFVGEWNNEYNFIHNGYMFYPLKMGLHGLLIPLLFIGVFVAALRRALNGATARARIVPACAAGTFLALCLATYTEPHWVRGEGLVTICSMIFLVMAAPRLDRLRARSGTATQPPAAYKHPGTPVRGRSPALAPHGA